MAVQPAQDGSIDLRAVTARPTCGGKEHRRWDRLVASHHYVPFHGALSKGLGHVRRPRPGSLRRRNRTSDAGAGFKPAPARTPDTGSRCRVRQIPAIVCSSFLPSAALRFLAWRPSHGRVSNPPLRVIAGHRALPTTRNPAQLAARIAGRAQRPTPRLTRRNPARARPETPPAAVPQLDGAPCPHPSAVAPNPSIAHIPPRAHHKPEKGTKNVSGVLVSGVLSCWVDTLVSRSVRNCSLDAATSSPRSTGCSSTPPRCSPPATAATPSARYGKSKDCKVASGCAGCAWLPTPE